MNIHESLSVISEPDSKPWITEEEFQKLLFTLKNLTFEQTLIAAGIFTLFVAFLYGSLKLLKQGSKEKGD